MLPKAARMESFDDESSTAHQHTNTTPHIIVACPTCTTKFAVESSVVAAVEDPRFHCSRCDEVFSLEDVGTVLHRDLSGDAHAVPSAEAHTVAAPTHTAPQVAPALNHHHPYGQNTRVEQPARTTIPAPVRPSDFSIGGTTTSLTSSGSTHQEPTHQEHCVAPPPTPSPTSTPPTSNTSSPRWTLGENSVETTPHVAGTPELSEIPIDTRHTDLSEQPPTQGSSSTQTTPTMQQVDSAPARKEKWLNNATGQQQELRFDEQSSVVNRSPASISRGQSLALLAAPLFVVLAALFVASYSIRLSPDALGAAITNITGLFGGVTHTLPPAELTLSKVAIRVTRIASKEQVPVVSGVLTNRSTSTVDGVTLEALGFDSRGDLLVSAQAPLRSALGKEKLSELPLDAVKRFQHSLGAKSATIRAGEEIPFTIALIPDGSREDQPSLAELDIAQIKYFSARVFSVTGVQER